MAADKDVSERFSSRVWHFYQWILFVKNSTWLGRLIAYRASYDDYVDYCIQL